MASTKDNFLPSDGRSGQAAKISAPQAHPSIAIGDDPAVTERLLAELEYLLRQHASGPARGAHPTERPADLIPTTLEVDP